MSVAETAELEVDSSSDTVFSDSPLFSKVLCNFDYWSLIGLFCGVEVCYSTMCAVSKFHLTFLLNRGGIKKESSCESSKEDAELSEDSHRHYYYFTTMRSTSVWIQKLFAQQSFEMDFFKLEQRHFQLKRVYPMNIFLLARLMDESIRLNQSAIQRMIEQRFVLVRRLFENKHFFLDDRKKTETKKTKTITIDHPRSSLSSSSSLHLTKDHIMNDIWKFCFLDEVRLNKERSELIYTLDNTQRELNKLFNQFSMTKDFFLETLIKLRLDMHTLSQIRRIIAGLTSVDNTIGPLNEIRIHIQSGDFITLNDSINIPIQMGNKDCKKCEKLAKRCQQYITQMKQESKDLSRLKSDLDFLEEHITKLLYGRDEIAMNFQLEWLSLKSK